MIWRRERQHPLLTMYPDHDRQQPLPPRRARRRRNVQIQALELVLLIHGHLHVLRQPQQMPDVKVLLRALRPVRLARHLAPSPVVHRLRERESLGHAPILDAAELGDGAAPDDGAVEGRVEGVVLEGRHLEELLGAMLPLA